MLKLKNNAIKTLVGSMAKGGIKVIYSTGSPEAVALNRKLRDAFGILAVPKNTPAPQTKKSETPENKNKLPAWAPAQEKKLPDTSLNNITAATPEKLRPIDQAAEKAKKIAIEQEIKAQKAAEELKHEQERIAIQQKIQQEKLRVEKEKEEKRRQLALLEAEREKKIRQEAEQKKQSAPEPEKNETKNLPFLLQTLASKLRSKKDTLEKQLASIPSAKAPLEQKRLVMVSKITMIKNSELAVVEEREREIEKKAASEKSRRLQNTDPAQEKILEEKIWDIEDQRKEVEKQRWNVEDRINKIVAEAAEIDARIARMETETAYLKQNIQDISGKEKLVKFAADKNKLEEEILKIIGEKETLLPSLEDATKIKNDAQNYATEISQKEISSNAELNSIEEQERLTLDPIKKRQIEQSRWRANSAIKEIIKSKWESSEKLKETTFRLQSLQEKIAVLNSKIDKIQNNIGASEIDLEKQNLPVRKIRDTIRDLLKENDIEADQDILKDIIQTEDTQKQGSDPQTAREPANNQKTPIATPDSITAESIASQTAAPKDGGENEKPVGDANQQNAAIRPTQAQTTPETSVSDQKETPKPSAAPIEIKKSEPAKKEIPSENEADKVPAPTNDAEKRADTTSENAPDKTPEDKADPAQKPPINETAAFYREQVEASPAKRIRVFPREEPPVENNREADTATAPIETKKEAYQKSTESMGDNEGEKPNSRNWDSRWDQIKKTTTPTSNPAAQPVAPDNQAAEVKIDGKSNNNKLLVRMMVIFILAGILGITLVMILSKNSNTTVVKKNGVAPVATTTIGTKKPNAGDKTINDSTTPTLAVISTIPIYTEDLTSVPNLIFPYLQKKFDGNGYYKISIKNKKNNSTIGLKQFLSIYKVNAPSLFYSSVSDDFTLFIYSNNGKNRLGLVTGIANGNSLETALDGWKGSIAQDTDNMFKLMGRKTQAKPESLKFTTAVGTGATQYQTMNFAPAEDNFSLAWANYKQKYFILATSNKAISEIFNQLPK